MSETRLTPERRAELARLCEAATAGPWAYESIAEKSNEWVVGQAFREVNGEYVPVDGRVESGEVEDTIIERRLVGMNESGHASFADAAFIAAARTALPEALAEVDRLMARWEALKAWLDDEIPSRDIAPRDREDAAQIEQREETLAEMTRLEQEP